MNLLSIGGSDPSGGAGIQSDVKTFDQLGAYGFTIVTAITAQNSSGFGMVQPASVKILKDQMKSIFSDFKIDGIKISMVYNSDIIKSIFEELKDKKIPIVVDPVIKSTTGGILLEEKAVKDFKKFLIPLATVITPNKSEVEFLTKLKINSKKSLLNSVRKIQGLGAKNVIITGIENEKKITDLIFDGNKEYSVTSNRLEIINHGSGCNYASALLFYLASGRSIREAAKRAKNYTYESIKNAKNIGRGITITENKNQDKRVKELNQAILRLITIKNIYKNIPECQTNFVFSKNNPKTTKDVLGIQGRIVKTGNNVTVAGNLEYGGSKHVATALIAMNKKFPEICSAINLKYKPTTISKLKKKKFGVLEYDRSEEPKKNKKKGSSVGWGIKTAIKQSKIAPDVVYHKGDFGKEAMIIVFGENPSQILEKISKFV